MMHESAGHGPIRKASIHRMTVRCTVFAPKCTIITGSIHQTSQTDGRDFVTSVRLFLCRMVMLSRLRMRDINSQLEHQIRNSAFRSCSFYSFIPARLSPMHTAYPRCVGFWAMSAIIRETNPARVGWEATPPVAISRHRLACQRDSDDRQHHRLPRRSRICPNQSTSQTVHRLCYARPSRDSDHDVGAQSNRRVFR